MVKVNAHTVAHTPHGAVTYTPEGPDVAQEDLPYLGDHLFDDGKPEPEGEQETLTDKVERLRSELDEALAELAKETEQVAAAKAEADAEAKAAEEAKAKAAGESTPQKLERPDGRAGAPKWLAYAEQEGITVPEGDREDKAAIVTLVEEHEKAQAPA